MLVINLGLGAHLILSWWKSGPTPLRGTEAPFPILACYSTWMLSQAGFGKDLHTCPLWHFEGSIVSGVIGCKTLEAKLKTKECNCYFSSGVLLYIQMAPSYPTHLLLCTYSDWFLLIWLIKRSAWGFSFFVVLQSWHRFNESPVKSTSVVFGSRCDPLIWEGRNPTYFSEPNFKSGQ